MDATDIPVIENEVQFSNIVLAGIKRQLNWRLIHQTDLPFDAVLELSGQSLVIAVEFELVRKTKTPQFLRLSRKFGLPILIFTAENLLVQSKINEPSELELRVELCFGKNLSTIGHLRIGKLNQFLGIDFVEKIIKQLKVWNLFENWTEKSRAILQEVQGMDDFRKEKLEKEDSNEDEDEDEDEEEEEEAIFHRPFFRDTRALHDGAARDPKLNFPHIAEQLVAMAEDLVANAPDGRDKAEPLVTIGLYGPWGAGKSTMINALREAFTAHGFFTVTFNAWKWDPSTSLHNHVLDTFMATLKKEMPGQVFLLHTRRALRALKRVLRYLGVGALVLLGLLALNQLGAFPKSSADWQKLSAWPGNGWSLLTLPVLAVTVWVLSALLRKVVQGGATYVDGLLFGKRAQELDREGLGRAYQDIAAGIGLTRDTFKPFVFFIDDLDRCGPEQVAAVVESVHSITAAGAIAFLACDDQYVSRALSQRFKEMKTIDEGDTAFGRRFLEKIVQIPFHIPSVSSEDLKDLGLLTDTFSVAEEVERVKTGEPPLADTAAETDDRTDDDTGERPVADTAERRNRAKAQAAQWNVDNWIDGLMAGLPKTLINTRRIRQRVDIAVSTLKPADKRAIRRVFVFVVAELTVPKWLESFLAGEKPDPARMPGVPRHMTEWLYANRPFLGTPQDGREAETLIFHLLQSNFLVSRMIRPLGFDRATTARLRADIDNAVAVAAGEGAVDPNRIAAFIVADRIDPNWLDSLVWDVERPPGDLSRAPAAAALLRSALGDDPEILKLLYRFASVRITAIIGDLLRQVVEPTQLNIRQVKALSNTLKLYLNIADPPNEAEARRIAAFLFADRFDREWLDAHFHEIHGQSELISNYEELEALLIGNIGEDPARILELYALVGRQPAPASDFRPIKPDHQTKTMAAAD